MPRRAAPPLQHATSASASGSAEQEQEPPTISSLPFPPRFVRPTAASVAPAGAPIADVTTLSNHRR